MEAELQNKYFQFIRVITSRIDANFENQKEYIKCKEGCALCCKNGEYPCTELEFEFLKLGIGTLDIPTREIVVNNIQKLKAEKKLCKDEKFLYECPFLINNRCCVYKYRMIICRTFGLPYYDDKSDADGDNRIKIPFCMNRGLNYSNVLDKETGKISNKLYEEGGYKNNPQASSLTLNVIKNEFGQKVMGLNFGEVKPLIDWL